MDGDIQVSDGVVQSMQDGLFMYFQEVNMVAEELSMALVQPEVQESQILGSELVKQVLFLTQQELKPEEMPMLQVLLQEEFLQTKIQELPAEILEHHKMTITILDEAEPEQLEM
ncbi:hypothetical protein GCM10027164_17940 [Algoriphagus taiwanensis]